MQEQGGGSTGSMARRGAGHAMSASRLAGQGSAAPPPHCTCAAPMRSDSLPLLAARGPASSTARSSSGLKGWLKRGGGGNREKGGRMSGGVGGMTRQPAVQAQQPRQYICGGTSWQRLHTCSACCTLPWRQPLHSEPPRRPRRRQSQTAAPGPPAEARGGRGSVRSMALHVMHERLGADHSIELSEPGAGWRGPCRCGGEGGGREGGGAPQQLCSCSCPHLGDSVWRQPLPACQQGAVEGQQVGLAHACLRCLGSHRQICTGGGEGRQGD